MLLWCETKLIDGNKINLLHPRSLNTQCSWKQQKRVQHQREMLIFFIISTSSLSYFHKSNNLSDCPEQDRDFGLNWPFLLGVVPTLQFANSAYFQDISQLMILKYLVWLKTNMTLYVELETCSWGLYMHIHSQLEWLAQLWSWVLFSEQI